MQKFLFIILLLFNSGLKAQNQKIAPKEELKLYYLVILTKGPNRSQDSLTVAKIQKAHLENIGYLYEKGKIDLAGPFAEDGEWRGLFIMKAKDEAEVKELVETDPAVRSGRLSYLIKGWYSEPGNCLR